MTNIYSLLKLFGERYIYCTDKQAEFDAKAENREDLVAAFSAILDYMNFLNHDE